MNKTEYYMSLPHDLSGSLSKNRFRIELLWGINKAFNLLEKGEEFSIIFDYVCDIEIHCNGGFEFYQIKSHNRNKRSYSVKDLTKKESSNTVSSLLGKLYILNTDDYDIKLALVTNTPFASLKFEMITSNDEISFTCLQEETQHEIKTALKEELSVEEIDLSKIFYIYTEMNLKNPENEIRGKIIKSFERIKGCEPNKPNALYRLIFDSVSEKACYEYSSMEYDQLVSKKGLTRTELEYMLDCHANDEKSGIVETQEYINSLKNPRERMKYNSALGKVLTALAKSRTLQEKEKDIAKFLLKSKEYETDQEAVGLLTSKYHDSFSLEITNEEKIVLYILIIKRFGQGVYESENDI